MAKRRVLVVDDEPGFLDVCTDTLAGLADVEVVGEAGARRAQERLVQESWDLLITDIRMPDIGGVDLLRCAREQDPNIVVVMITAFPGVDTAVESMKLGAVEYLTKPFRPEALRATVRRRLDEKRVRDEHRVLARQVEGSHRTGDMLGNSVAMGEVFDTVSRAAATDVDVLITGETGTGKELVARMIHRQSSRSGERFVPVDCGALPEELLESELFGHERGAFTGAQTRSLGLLEFADKGTFFLDEIGHLPQKLQAKLLRTLQERRIRRVGGNEEIPVDVRVLAATSLDLDEAIRNQRFRAELYYRINVARVKLPPLRDRRDDIPLLAEHFVNQHAPEIGCERVEIDPDALAVLCEYHWPGNVREFQNAIRRALVTAQGEEIHSVHLPDEILSAAGNHTGKNRTGFFAQREQQITTFECRYLEELLRSHQGNVASATHTAQIPRGTLYRLLKKHGLDPAEFRP